MGIALHLRAPGFRHGRHIAAHGAGPRSVVLEPMNTGPRPVLRECGGNGRSTGVDRIRCLAIVGVVGYDGVVLGNVEVDELPYGLDGFQSMEVQPSVTSSTTWLTFSTPESVSR